MSKIHLLSEEIINQIAAGEVVERPASVVKELVENALDAEASRIQVLVDQGGSQKITVIDNGCGMDQKDLESCVLRHTTSKINSLADLHQIHTLGFRGEALASIAAVSKLTVRSKLAADQLGRQIQMQAGKQISLNPVGMPSGTTVIVEDLFFNTPVRKKFLKSVNTEIRQITQTVINNCLMYPQVAFTLVHNQKTLLQITPDKNLAARVKQILGNETFNQLLPVFYDHPHLKVSGFIAKPQLFTETSRKQWVIVNQRAVNNKTILKAIKEAYGTLLPAKAYPVYVIKLDLPADLVDVNTHPRKEEVKFINNSLVFNTIKTAVTYALSKANLIFHPKLQPKSTRTENLITSRFKTKLPSPVFRLPLEAAWPKPKQTAYDFDHPTTFGAEKFQQPFSIIQINQLYIITQSTTGLIIVDQHAAHERILYEQFLAGFRNHSLTNQSQPLLITTTMQLTAPEIQVLKQNLSLLTKIGFDIQVLAKNQLQVKAIPIGLIDKNISTILNEFVDDLIENKPIRGVDNQSLTALTYLACRSAVKSGDKLEPMYMKHILEQLEQTQEKYTCPHGRPTKIEITWLELANKFGRSK